VQLLTGAIEGLLMLRSVRLAQIAADEAERGAA